MGGKNARPTTDWGSRHARQEIFRFGFLAMIRYCRDCGGETDAGLKCVRCRKPRAFHHTEEWAALREHALDYYGRRCMACGSRDELQADHIKPKSKYPELALWFANLQVLCRHCNFRKGARTEQDWRPEALLV